MMKTILKFAVLLIDVRRSCLTGSVNSVDDHCYIEFFFSHLDIFLRLQKLFDYIKQSKKEVIQVEDFENALQLLAFF
ncbi:hypothetical protein [Bacillus sp. REN10]|uniref:hypothetical protein n=1 Tax=Bacillus sp. REN10 TaxID=2782541 RepID=UPI00193C0A5D|nr:hypothetical protein [Bacillus sp. REN10]